VHTILVIAGIGLAVFLFFFLKNIAHHKMFRRGWAIFIWRFLSGASYDGNPMTDAGWLRKGTKALTKTGYAPRYYFWPRWKRMVMRCSMIVLPPFIVVGVLLDLALTLGAGSAALLTGASYLGFKGISKARRHAIATTWLQPLHMRVAPLAGVPLSVSPSSWLSLTPDRTVATLELPPGFNDTEPQRERLLARASEALGMEEPEHTWMLEGKHQKLMLEASAPPPDFVNLGHILKAIKEAQIDELVLGLGKKSLPVSISLHLDSPHVGASMGAGAGKSTLARFIAAQAMRNGAIVVFLDIKRISHVWARTARLPNMIYADTPELIHTALLWLGTELDRRNELALATADVEGEVGANVGARIVIIAEELNLTANRLRAYWREMLADQGQSALTAGQSPALEALQDVAFAGRQVLMNIFFIGQMLTARATGGTSGGDEARENIGVRMLARYTERNWKMLVPEHKMPLVSDVMGRIQVVASGRVRECQVPYISGSEAVEMSRSGIIAVLPPDVPTILLNPFASLRPGLAHPHSQPVPTWPGSDEIPAIPIAEVEIVTDNPETVTDDVTDNVSGMPAVSLREVIDQNLFTGLTLAAIRKARQRDGSFPKPLPERKGLDHVYDLGALAEWWQLRQRGRK